MTDGSVQVNDGYTDRLGRTVSDSSDRWLERWNWVLDRARDGKLLELGCGGGRDTRYLAGLGLRVVAGDYSTRALELAREAAPLADVRLLDLREPLSFPDESFQVVLASLCLHFFEWSQTMAIMEEIHRCLSPGGFLLVRVNSSGDLHGKAGELREIEPNLFQTKGGAKRFFDREAMERLSAGGWKSRSLEELTVDRYGPPKVVWEALLEKVTP